MRSYDTGQHVIIDSIDHHDDGFQTLNLNFDPENCTPWPAVFDEHLNAFPSPALLRKLGRYATKDEHRPASGYPSPPPTPAKKRRVDTPQKPQAQDDYLEFYGTGVDADPYVCSGILHALPPQHGIPGWQRITLMKVFGLESPSAPSSPPNGSFPTSSSSNSNSSSSSSSSSSSNYGPSAQSNGVSIIPAVVDGSCWAYEGVVLPGGMIMLGRWWSPTDDPVDMLGTGPFIFWNVDEK